MPLDFIISAFIRHTLEVWSQVSDSSFPEARKRWGPRLGFGPRVGSVLTINTGRVFILAWTNLCLMPRAP